MHVHVCVRVSTYRGLECSTLIQKASVVCPDKVRPDMSTIVPETKMGILTLYSSMKTSMANRAAWVTNKHTHIYFNFSAFAYTLF